MLLDFSDEELKVIRQGLLELPIKVALDTLSKFDEKIISEKMKLVKMAEGVDGNR